MSPRTFSHKRWLLCPQTVRGAGRCPCARLRVSAPRSGAARGPLEVTLGVCARFVLLFGARSVYIFPVQAPSPSAAPSRILTSRSDVTGTEMRNREGARGARAHGFEVLF